MKDLPYTTAEAATILEEAAKKEKLSPLEKAALKKTLEDVKALQESFQDLQGKTLKIYYVEDEDIFIDTFTDVEGLLDILATGKYQAVHLKCDNCTYYITYHANEENNHVVQLIGINTNQLTSTTYGIYDEGWEISDDPSESYIFTLSEVEPGTKLYKHEISFDLAPYVASFPIVVTRVSDSHTWNVDSIPNVKLTIITLDKDSYPNSGSLNSALIIGLYNSINSIRLEDNPVENCSVSYYGDQFRGSGYLQNMFKLKAITDGYTVSYSGPGIGPASGTWTDTVTPL